MYKTEKEYKFKELFIPYLIVFTIVVFGYFSVAWLLYYKLGILEGKAEHMTLWIPIISACVSVYFVFVNKVDVYEFPEEQTKLPSFYLFLISASICIPILFLPNLLPKISYSIVEIQKPSEIIHFPKERYFTIKEYTPQKSTISYYGTYDAKRYKGKTTLDLSLFVSTNLDANIWFCYEVKQHYSGDLSQKDIDEKIERFLIRQKKEAHRYYYYGKTFFTKLGDSFRRDYYLSAIKKKFSINESTAIIIEPDTRSFNRLYSKEVKRFWYSVLGCIFFIYCLLDAPQLKKEVMMKYEID